ncbi:MAG: hypothetical protein E6H44_14000 [Betaproteobacteria bacterium]|nr:MAG: hypothetical protein E6H44_14000 [Betaproteobacteria bacterium]
MSNYYLALVIVVVALAGVSEAFGQQATEMYIPIGQSPGVSGKSTLLATIESVDPGKRTLTVSGPAGSRKFQLADRTLIWIDRSAQKQRNQTGTLADLQRGRKVEIKPDEGAGQAVAKWIKVQL